MNNKDNTLFYDQETAAIFYSLPTETYFGMFKAAFNIPQDQRYPISVKIGDPIIVELQPVGELHIATDYMTVFRFDRDGNKVQLYPNITAILEYLKATLESQK